MNYHERIQHLREQRLARANELRRRGKTYAEIGAALGITKQRAHQLVNPRTRETRQ